MPDDHAMLCERLLRAASVTPGALAIEDDERSWSHAEWAQAVAQAQTRLARCRVPHGQAFAWLGYNRAEMLAMLAACASQRVRFLPLNWRLAARELASVLRHGDVADWHVDASLMPLADAALAQRGEPMPPDGSARTDDAMLVYTSGTTGEPRGAIHTQAGMVHNIDAAVAAQALDPTTRTLAALPLFHVGGLCIQVLPTLAAGGAVCLQARFDAGRWLHAVSSWRPTTSLMVPATMQAVLEHPDWGATDLRSLRFITAGSSIVPKALIERFHERGVPVAQVYGATETGPVSMVLKPDDALRFPGLVGEPALGVSVRLVQGEIWLRAPNLARAYHRRLHDENFTDDGWFKTGDLAVKHGDRYEVVGRSKDLIISGGENIHPAEVEQVTQTVPGVRECAVLGLPHPKWGEVPVAVLVGEPLAVPAQKPSWLTLQAAWHLGLAKYKHPHAVRWVDALPKTALGKVKRAELVHLFDSDQTTP